MDQIDTVVIGAGVVGLAVARALALAGREVVVLEQATAVGTGVSSRNSEVIHAGLYYAPGSLKARLCVRGKELLYVYSAQRSFDAKACGKLVVATSPEQMTGLRALESKAKANGVVVERVTGEQAQAMEPELQCTEALWSPTTGIVDSHGWMLALQGDLEQAGGMVALGSGVVGAEQVAEGVLLRVQSADCPEGTELLARQVINAAGLHACTVAGLLLAGTPAAAQLPTPHYAKGSYYSLACKAPFQRLIYPAPQDAWLGVHLTLDLGGQARFGPDLEWLDVTDPSAIDYTVDPARATGFYAEVRRYWPGLPDGVLQPAYSGVRPKIHARGEPAPDFRIDGPAQHGLKGVVNLLGIESPGLTSSMAIAEQVVQILKQ